MAITKCKQLKSIQQDVLKFLDDFDGDFKKFSENKAPVDPINKRNLRDAIKTLFNFINDAWTNTPSGKKFFVSDIKSFEGNMRKELEIAPGVIVRIGDVVRVGEVIGGQKGTREHTVVGFHIGKNRIITAYQEGKFRKKIKHVILDEGFFYKKRGLNI
ncbi:hypothetical protein HON36_02335 [Candidatus Parcubacteria bacterium]|jgi:ribosomal protein L27|nr:hypothetical protein [Candidatus Parcubacteria bacterium]MBT7228069.1 hypothetical protein [Candidatus Parcubacteria bacterium]